MFVSRGAEPGGAVMRRLPLFKEGQRRFSSSFHTQWTFGIRNYSTRKPCTFVLCVREKRGTGVRESLGMHRAALSNEGEHENLDGVESLCCSAAHACRVCAGRLEVLLTVPVRSWSGSVGV